MYPRSFFLLTFAAAALACSSAPDESSGPTSGSGGSSGTPASSSGTPTSGVSSSTGDDFGTITGGNVTTGAGGGGGGDCKSVLDVTYRDFKETHPDFEMASFRGDEPRRQLIEPTLDGDRKPVFLDSVGCFAQLPAPLGCRDGVGTQKTITSEESFNQWYRDVPGVNMTFPKELALQESPPGSGQYVFDSADFFPLAPEEGFGITPPNNGKRQNFLFTTEIHLMFGYVAGQKFTFRGDDDIWIFINGKLALDLGSMHGPAESVIDFDAQAQDLGIFPGNSYAMDIFHAERHTDGSNFRIETNISCFVPVDIPL
ncbi:fibro-slime domain-containing protein [Sorangium atrum]|uniref:Fibro-slime domain-containing protein n=1 Tax=Sorangium atrum TaxID=2995308 RepID=A0ABT5C5I6_9BACT|nr:fibro-slime domain-containing protein [Sorangium aterium]MDC0681679.1 fibro-slime domain-containing protein [Sorangium aterium]